MLDWFLTLDDNLWLKPRGVGEEEAVFLRKALRLRKGHRVLDAPCGTGRITGAKGALEDCLVATERLLELGMKPRWQLFLSRRILPELGDLMRLPDHLRLRERVQALGDEPDGTITVDERHIRPGWDAVENRRVLLRGTERKEFHFSLRLYSAVELSRLLTDAGFVSADVYGGLDGSPYDQTARRLVAVARKA